MTSIRLLRNASRQNKYRIYSYMCKKDPEVLAQNTEGIFACTSSKTMVVVVDSLVCSCFCLVMRIWSHQCSCQLETLVTQNYLR